MALGEGEQIKATQAGCKIIKKVFLFWLLNMARECEHVHRLELRKFYLISCCEDEI